MIAIALFCAVLALTYLFLTWNLNYWTKRGIKGPKPRIIVGSCYNVFTGKQNIAENAKEIYDKYKKIENVVGTFMFRSPILMLTDSSQVNDVFVNFFNHFNENDAMKMFDLRNDPLFKHNPFVTTGEAWRLNRAIVTPGLTQMRIKSSYPDMLKVAQKLSDYVEKISRNQDWLDGKNIAIRFTAENISESVLGIQSGCFTENSIPIVENVRLLTEDNANLNYYSLLTGLVPEIAGLFTIKFSPQKVENFFKELISEVIALRRQKPIERQDYLDHILTLTEKKNIDDEALYSHIMTFLIDGLETSAITIAHTLLLLGANPKKAKKLRDEILQNLNKDGLVDFEQLNELPYLDACIHETLRLYPPALFSFKTVTSDFEFTNKDGSKTKAFKGETIHIPVYAIHYDEDVYPQPKEFQPERFMPENGGVKKYRDMGLFLGFGNGPRICVGMRFGLTQTKLAIMTIVKNFDIKTDPSTNIPQLNARSLFAGQNGGVRVKFEKIA